MTQKGLGVRWHVREVVLHKVYLHNSLVGIEKSLYAEGHTDSAVIIQYLVAESQVTIASILVLEVCSGVSRI